MISTYYVVCPGMIYSEYTHTSKYDTVLCGDGPLVGTAAAAVCYLGTHGRYIRTEYCHTWYDMVWYLICLFSICWYTAVRDSYYLEVLCITLDGNVRTIWYSYLYPNFPYIFVHTSTSI